MRSKRRYSYIVDALPMPDSVQQRLSDKLTECYEDSPPDLKPSYRRLTDRVRRHIGGIQKGVEEYLDWKSRETPGFEKYMARNLAHLTLESLVVSPEYRKYFTTKQLLLAHARLGVIRVSRYFKLVHVSYPEETRKRMKRTKRSRKKR